MNITVTHTITASPELLSVLAPVASILAELLSKGNAAVQQSESFKEVKAQNTSLQKAQNTSLQTETQKEQKAQKSKVEEHELKPQEATEEVEEAVDTKATETETDTTEDGSLYAVEDIRAAVAKKAQEGKRSQIKKLLGEFNSASATSLPKEKYNAFMKRLEEI